MPTVFITGANRGIGLEMARQYGADGWSVIATCRNPIAPGELATIPGDIRVHGLDVADHRQVERLAGDMADTKIDLLINNAGVYGDRNTGHQDIDFADWDQAFRINTMAPLKVAGAFLPLVAANGGGMIATVSSVLSSIAESSPNSASYAYRTSKAAVNMAMHVFAEEVRAQQAYYHQHGIHAVPAVVINDRHLIQGGQPVEVFEQALREIAAEAPGEPPARA